MECVYHKQKQGMPVKLPANSKELFFSPIALLALTVATPTLTGCAAPAALYAAQYIPTAIVAYQHVPGGADVEVDHPGKGAVTSSLNAVKTVITDNRYSQEYLENEPGLFNQVKLAKTTPLSTAGAAKSARESGVDAFMMVDTGRATAQGGLMAKIIYGSVSVTLVSRDGTVLYKQSAKLVGKLNSAKNPSEREVAEALAMAIVKDLKASKAPVQVAYSDSSRSRMVLQESTQSANSANVPAQAASNILSLSEIQRRLTILGYNTGPQDGKYGRLTGQALSDFQADYGINVTGMPDEATTAALNGMSEFR